ncbi:Holliday junction branch migration protein RuvA [Candidatus Woesebacteria bacterium]|nr:Holliday junction branch migration protein RuvA [Candidatus Woesebacteria bacterium]
MIGKIKGTLSEVEGTVALVETASGLYYHVHLTQRLLTTFLVGEPIEVYIYHHIREDAQTLFGFQDKQEYKLFQMLITVSGVGAKSAYSIISHTTVEQVVHAVKSNDVKYFTEIPGLGKKTSLKIILELSSKFKSEFVFQNEYESPEDKTVVEALSALGFTAAEARGVLSSIDDSLSVEEKVTAAIRALSQG